MLRVGSTARRSRGLTSGMTPPTPRLYDLEYQQLTEDFRDGLIGYNAYSEYLTEKLEGLKPGTYDYFAIKKKLDNITFQQADRELDFKYKVLKTVEPDDYISWKEAQLEGLDPSSNAYMQLQTDIKSAKEEKRSRERNVLEFDILIGEANKQDLIGWYNEQAQNATDPETQMKYITLGSKTQESLNKELEAEYRKERALEEQEWALKFRRGDFGETPEENIEAYYDLIAGRYEEEYDPSKQMTYLSKLDSLEKQAEDIYEGRAKKAEAASKKVRAENEKLEKERFEKAKNHFENESKLLDKKLESGNLTKEEWAQEKYRMLKGADGYINDLYSFEGSQFMTDSLWDKINGQLDAMTKEMDENSFYKAVFPIDRDGDGHWDENERVWLNPDFKFVMNFSQEGKAAGTFSVKAVYDDTKSPYMDGHIQDPQSGLWYETSKDKEGNRIVRMPDGEGGVITSTEDSETGQWGTKHVAEGKEPTFKPSRIQPMEIDMSKASPEQITEYYRNEQKEQDVMARSRVALGKKSLGYLKGDIGAIGEGVGAPIRKITEGMMAKGPEEVIGGIIKDVGGRVREEVSKIRDPREDIDTMGLSDIAEEGKDFLIGAKGDAVKAFQRRAVEAGELASKFATGYFGPESKKAMEKITTKVSSMYSKETAGRFLGDVGKITGAISTAAKQKLEGAKTAYAQNKIGGALGDIYSKREDLQKVFDPSGKGKGAWAGKTIQDWARMYGTKEEPTLKGFEKKITPFKMPTFDFTKTKQQIAKPFEEIKKTFFKPVQDVRKKISYDFSRQKFRRFGSDVGVIKRATSSWLKKLKFWGK